MKSAALVVLLCVIGMGSARPQSKTVVTNKPPVIAKFESSAPVVYTCGHGFCKPKERRTVGLSVTASDSENSPLVYRYSVSGGEIVGEGSTVSWKLGDQPFGRYSATVKVKDGIGAEATSTLEVVVEGCLSCFIPDPPCPVVTVEVASEYTDSKETFRGEILSFHIRVMTDAHFLTRPDYNWTVTGGKLLKGQNTPWVTVEANGELDPLLLRRLKLKDLICRV
jgi:hypothetical protein